jgi:hypothetical protein
MVPQENNRDKAVLSSVKIGSYGVLGVVSAVFMSSVAPPLFTYSSSRAVINSPVTAITSPIGGIVTKYSSISSDSTVPFAATIENDRVDRSTLIGLQMQMASLRNEVDLKRSILADYFKRIVDLQSDLERQRRAAIVLSENALQSADISIRTASLKAESRKIDLNRQLRLLDKGAVAGSRAEVENRIEEEETSKQAAAINGMRLKEILNNLNDGIYVGTENESLASIEREIRTRKSDYSQIELQLASLVTRQTELSTLLSAEEARVARLNKAEIFSDPSARLYRTVAHVGKQINPGDTVAEAINCQNAFVVAIFSEREAQSLSVGSKVQVSIGNEPAPFNAVVSKLVPRTTERVDLDFAVPFPPTERRELYAYVTPDDAIRKNSQDMAKFCSVGSWVTVSLDRQWAAQAEATFAQGANKLYATGQHVAESFPVWQKTATEIAVSALMRTKDAASLAGEYAQETASQGYIAVSSLFRAEARELESMPPRIKPPTKSQDG